MLSDTSIPIKIIFHQNYFNSHYLILDHPMSEPLVQLSFKIGSQPAQIYPIQIGENDSYRLESENNQKWEHDHGKLPSLKHTKQGVDLIKSLKEAKNISNLVLSKLIDLEVNGATESVDGLDLAADQIDASNS